MTGDAGERPMIPKYQWVCKACGAGNTPAVTSCSSCNMPAIASSEEVDLARTGGGSAAVYLRRQESAVDKARWHALPAWKKMLIILGIGFCFLALVWLLLAFTIIDHVYGGIALLAGMGIMWASKKIL